MYFRVSESGVNQGSGGKKVQSDHPKTLFEEQKKSRILRSDGVYGFHIKTKRGKCLKTTMKEHPVIQP